MVDEASGLRQLSESKILVCGGTAGIGRASAAALLRAGAPGVVVNGRGRERAEAARSELQARHRDAQVHAICGDMTDTSDASRVVDEAVEALGRIDVLICSIAGEDVPQLFHDQALDDLPGLVNRGLLGPILASRAVLPHMMAAKSGAIINIASDAAKVATPGEAVIGGIMAGIVMFTRGLAIEAKRSGIRANCITPSIVRGTPLYDRLMAAPFSGKIFAKAEQMANLGVVEADEVAELAVFLASPAAAKITGQAISINGGISAA